MTGSSTSYSSSSSYRKLESSLSYTRPKSHGSDLMMKLQCLAPEHTAHHTNFCFNFQEWGPLLLKGLPGSSHSKARGVLGEGEVSIHRAQ